LECSSERHELKEVIAMALVPWRTYRGWDPFEEILSMRTPMNRLFGETLGLLPTREEEALGRTWAVPVDIHEDKDNIVVKAELPGMKKDDVSIEVRDNVLTLKRERKQEKEIKEEKYLRIERVYGRFSRSFTLPNNIVIDKVKASYKDGVLEITLPKTEEAKPKAIPILSDT
jgi:HSP20 family protein